MRWYFKLFLLLLVLGSVFLGVKFLLDAWINGLYRSAKRFVSVIYSDGLCGMSVMSCWRCVDVVLAQTVGVLLVG